MHFLQATEAQTVIQETQVQSVVWEDLLAKEMATHSSTLAWKKSWTRLNDFTFTFHLHESYDFTFFGKLSTNSVHIVNTCFFEMEGVVLL